MINFVDKNSPPITFLHPYIKQSNQSPEHPWSSWDCNRPWRPKGEGRGIALLFL